MSFLYGDEDDFFRESTNSFDAGVRFSADQPQPTPFSSLPPNTLTTGTTPAATPAAPSQADFLQLQFDPKSTPGGNFFSPSSAAPSRTPLAMVSGQPDFKKPRVDSSIMTSELPIYDVTIKTEDGATAAAAAAAAAPAPAGDGDDDIKEAADCGAYESEEVRKGLAKLSYEGTGIKDSQQGIIDSAKEMTSGAEFKSAPPGGIVASSSSAAGVLPPPATFMTSPSSSAQAEKALPDYDLKITNVVSKVSLLKPELAEKAVAERENRENMQMNGEAGAAGGGPKKGRGKRGEKAQAKKRPSPFDLRMIADKMRNAKYTSRFSAARISMNQPKATGLIFGCGTVVCTGTKTIDENKKASKTLAKLIKKVTEMDLLFIGYTVVNMTATVDVHFDINLTTLSRAAEDATVTLSHFIIIIYYYFSPLLIFSLFFPHIYVFFACF